MKLLIGSEFYLEGAAQTIIFDDEQTPSWSLLHHPVFRLGETSWVGRSAV